MSLHSLFSLRASLACCVLLALPVSLVTAGEADELMNSVHDKRANWSGLPGFSARVHRAKQLEHDCNMTDTPPPSPGDELPAEVPIPDVDRDKPCYKSAISCGVARRP